MIRRRPTAGRTALLAMVAVASLAVVPPPAAAVGVLPIAVDDAMSMRHGKTKTVAAPGVLGNDVLLDVELLPGEDFTVELVQAPSHGTLDLRANGRYTYHAEADRIGTEQFKYRILGSVLGPSNDATVRITVTNSAPVAVGDAYDVVAGVEFQVPAPGFLANDSDADGDALVVDIKDGPKHGTFEQDGDGHFHYTADPGFSGDDSFSYRLDDGFTWSNTVTVVLHVTGPVATPAPTAPPTPTAAPTAQPTPAPTATRTPAPTVRPSPSPSPAPTPTAPGATRTPGPSATPVATAAATTSAATATATPLPTPTSAAVPPAGAGSGGGSSGGAGPIASPDGSGAGSTPPVAPAPTFVIAATADEPATIQLDASNVTFDGVTWAVPALVLTVPGLLLVLAVASQILAGLVLVPLARRSMDGDRRRRASGRSGRLSPPS